MQIKKIIWNVRRIPRWNTECDQSSHTAHVRNNLTRVQGEKGLDLSNSGNGRRL